jgi:hypothetical protein
LRLFMATEFMIRFEDEQDWKERYLKLDNTCLLIYKHKNVDLLAHRKITSRARFSYFRHKYNIVIGIKMYLTISAKRCSLITSLVFHKTQGF